MSILFGEVVHSYNVRSVALELAHSAAAARCWGRAACCELLFEGMQTGGVAKHWQCLLGQHQQPSIPGAFMMNMIVLG